MKRAITQLMICGMLTALAVVNCSDSPTSSGSNNPPPEPDYLPAVPVPASPTDALPAQSVYVDVGLSRPLRTFVPLVDRMCQMNDAGEMVWSTENRRLELVCPDGVLALAMCDPTPTDRTYVAESPRLLHRRYWKRLKQVVMDPGTDYSHAETVTFGSSTTNTVSQSWSTTIGVEVSASAGWGPFSAEVKSSFSQTTTREEVNSVTFSEESAFTDTYSVSSDPTKTIVFGLWQLVDVFVLVDARKVPIHASDTLYYVEIPEIAVVEFLNRDVIYQSVTKFEPAP